MTILSNFFAAVNILAVIVAGIVYWLLGAVWFSLLFGKTWANELERHGVKLKEGAKTGNMAFQFIGTFVMEVIVALGCAFLTWYFDTTNIMQAVKLGLGVGICFAAIPMMIAYSWESRPIKLVLIDVGYPVLGIIVSTIILTLWR